MARGDIYYADLPYPQGPPGKEQAGRRPAIAVQTDSTLAQLPTVVLIPLTTNLRTLRFPHTLLITPSPQNGLTAPSALLISQLRAIDKTRIRNRIGRLEPDDVARMEVELRRLFDL